MATPDIRNTEKPNMISTRNDFGTSQSSSGWDQGAPVSPMDTPQMDPYSPQNVGAAPGSMDHNSAWLTPTTEDVKPRDIGN
jgi:hypothetical protein